jgi:hypothetical protein
LKSAPSSNNLTPVDSTSSPALLHAGASTSPSAGHGGEGKGCGAIPAFVIEDLEVESEGVWSPRCVTSPARGPVLPAHMRPTPLSLSAATRVPFPAGRLLLRADLLHSPPPIRGRFGESDGGSLYIDDGGEGPFPFCSVLQFGSGNSFLSSALTAGDSRPSEAMLWPEWNLLNTVISDTPLSRNMIQKLVLDPLAEPHYSWRDGLLRYANCI